MDLLNRIKVRPEHLTGNMLSNYQITIKFLKMIKIESISSSDDLLYVYNNLELKHLVIATYKSVEGDGLPIHVEIFRDWSHRVFQVSFKNYFE